MDFGLGKGSRRAWGGEEVRREGRRRKPWKKREREWKRKRKEREREREKEGRRGRERERERNSKFRHLMWNPNFLYI
jgi:hypothetical protein